MMTWDKSKCLRTMGQQLAANDSILGNARYDDFGLSVDISADGSRIIAGVNAVLALIATKREHK